MDATDSYDKLG